MKFSVIVVDDDEIDRYIVQRVINSYDAEVELLEYSSGDDFSRLLLDEQKRHELIDPRNPPILVLLDINMPRMNGFEVLESLKDKFAELDRLLVFTMYSSSGHAEDRKDALRFDFVRDYIVKPLTLEKFQKIVDQHLKNWPAHQ